MSRTCGAMYGSGLGTMNTRYCGNKFGANMQAAVLSSAASSSVCGKENNYLKIDERNCILEVKI